MPQELPEHRVIAVNTATEHENRIHSDEVAARYGFRGGLVPGINVYGYLTVPVVRRYGRDWLDRGWMRVRFQKPVYEGEEVVVSAREHAEGIAVDAGRASAEAGLHDEMPPMPIFEHPLPEERPAPSADLIYPGAILGSFTASPSESQARIVNALADPLECYGEAVHPTVLLGLSNEILVRNFVLPAWIHTSSEVRNYGTVSLNRTLSVRGRIRDTFQDKGHEYLIAEVTLVDDAGSLVQHVLHVAIWRPRPR